MNTITETLYEQISANAFTDGALKNVIQESAHSRYGKVKRALAKGELISLRRGLYLFGKKYQRRGLDLFELAQFIYGPSYISFESALSYHRLIPEAVYAVTSASLKRSIEFHTPAGLFIFKKTPAADFYEGVQRIVTEAGAVFFMAHPWKALLDYVCAYQKSWLGIHPVVESLRIEEESLRNLELSVLDEIAPAYPARVRRFAAGVKKDLQA